MYVLLLYELDRENLWSMQILSLLTSVYYIHSDNIEEMQFASTVYTNLFIYIYFGKRHWSNVCLYLIVRLNLNYTRFYGHGTRHSTSAVINLHSRFVITVLEWMYLCVRARSVQLYYRARQRQRPWTVKFLSFYSINQDESLKSLYSQHGGIMYMNIELSYYVSHTNHFYYLCFEYIIRIYARFHSWIQTNFLLFSFHFFLCVCSHWPATITCK